MSGRHQPENGADSAEGLAPDIFDRIAAYMVATAAVDAMDPWWPDGGPLICQACSLPAVDDGYCAGHARLGRYRPTDENHWAANE